VLDWNAIDTVLLDMDGTLLDLAFDNFFWLEHVPTVYAQQRGACPEAAREHLHARFRAALGSLAFYSLDHWSRELDLDLESIKREVAHRIALRPFVLEFLDALVVAGRQRLLVTNAHRKTLDIKLAQIDLAQWFDHIVVSHAYDAPKEDQRFWQRLQTDYRFDPARTLLIDDTESVLVAAEAFGIGHLLTLLQPDSTQALRTDTRFPGLHHFDEIMPPALAGIVSRTAPA